MTGISVRGRRELHTGRGRRLACLLLAPALLLFCVQLITLGTVGKTLAWLAAAPAAGALSYLCLLGLISLFSALTGRLWAGYFIPALPILILSVVNYLKLVINGTPIYLSDLSMAAQAGELMGFLTPELTVGAGVIAGIVLVLAGIPALVLLGTAPKEERPGWRKRGTAALCALGVLLGALLLPKGWLAGSWQESQEERDERLGLLLGLYSGFLSRNSKPQELDKDAIALLTPPPEETQEPAVRPHVLMLMSEAFCDPLEILPGVEFDGDPIPVFRALSREWPSGTFLSNTYAGGTGNVEMEVFTGVPLPFLKEGEDLTTISGEGVYDRIPSVVRAFKDQGYATRFIHNYSTRLYNREDNLPRIGFDTLTFDRDFPAGAKVDGPYLTDHALAQEIIGAFEAQKGTGKPLFLYGLTMENHQPYFPGKFPQSSGFDPACETLGQEALDSIDALVYGIHAADAALGELIDYFADYDEPVLLVTWGDHLPGLYQDESNSLYSLLGAVPTADTLQWDAQVMKKMHQTHFLVWNNYGGEVEAPQVVSSSTLGGLTLDWAGVKKPRFFQYLDVVHQDMLAYRKRLYVSADGTPYSAPPEEDQAMVEQYRSLVYDILYGDGTTAAEMAGAP